MPGSCLPALTWLLQLKVRSLPQHRTGIASRGLKPALHTSLPLRAAWECKPAKIMHKLCSLRQLILRACLQAGRGVTDSQIRAAALHTLGAFAGKHGSGMALIETAGGPASPGPSGTLQVSAQHMHGNCACAGSQNKCSLVLQQCAAIDMHLSANYAFKLLVAASGPLAPISAEG